MTRPTAWFLHLSSFAVGATGLVYGWMLYLVTSDDPFAIVNHPWQPSLQHQHVLAAPFLVFACGLIWKNHVWGRIRTRFQARRRTGIALALLLGPMIVSGYLVQVATTEWSRRASIVTHVVTSCLWLAIYLVHQLQGRTAKTTD